jgi:ABC-2 type transport system permease protein
VKTGVSTQLLAFALTYLRINLLAALEYRLAFLAQAVGMMLNYLAFAVFWVLYFARFSDIGGWSVLRSALLWAAGAASIGLSAALSKLQFASRPSWSRAS